jgi:hypothetical protein
VKKFILHPARFTMTAARPNAACRQLGIAIVYVDAAAGLWMLLAEDIRAEGMGAASAILVQAY